MDDLTPDEVNSVSNAIEGTPDEKEEPTMQPPTISTSSKQIGSGNITSPQISKAQFVQLEEVAEATNLPPNELERLIDINVHVEVVLGQRCMPIEEILKLHPGSIVELDKLAGEPVEILANGQTIARAEIVIIEENFGVKIIEIVGTPKKLNVAQN